MPFSNVSPVRRHLRAKGGVLEENSDYGMASAEHIRTPFCNSAAKHWLILATVTVTIGFTAGLGGMVRSLLLHFVQHVAYGYRLHSIASHECFHGGVYQLVTACLDGQENTRRSTKWEHLVE